MSCLAVLTLIGDTDLEKAMFGESVWRLSSVCLTAETDMPVAVAHLMPQARASFSAGGASTVTRSHTHTESICWKHWAGTVLICPPSGLWGLLALGPGFLLTALSWWTSLPFVRQKHVASSASSDNLNQHVTVHVEQRCCGQELGFPGSDTGATTH